MAAYFLGHYVNFGLWFYKYLRKICCGFFPGFWDIPIMEQHRVWSFWNNVVSVNLILNPEKTVVINSQRRVFLLFSCPLSRLCQRWFFSFPMSRFLSSPFFHWGWTIYGDKYVENYKEIVTPILHFMQAQSLSPAFCSQLWILSIIDDRA